MKTRPAFVCAQAASLLTLTFQFYVEYVQKMICILINIEYFLEEKKNKKPLINIYQKIMRRFCDIIVLACVTFVPDTADDAYLESISDSSPP